MAIVSILLAAALAIVGIPGTTSIGLSETAAATSEAHDTGSEPAFRGGVRQGVATAVRRAGGRPPAPTASRPTDGSPEPPSAPAHQLPMWRGPPRAAI